MLAERLELEVLDELVDDLTTTQEQLDEMLRPPEDNDQEHEDGEP
jgi:hypothetical protein